MMKCDPVTDVTAISISPLRARMGAIRKKSYIGYIGTRESSANDARSRPGELSPIVG